VRLSSPLFGNQAAAGLFEGFVSNFERFLRCHEDFWPEGTRPSPWRRLVRRQAPIACGKCLSRGRLREPLSFRLRLRIAASWKRRCHKQLRPPIVRLSRHSRLDQAFEAPAISQQAPFDSGGKRAQNKRSRAGTNPCDRLFLQRTRRGIATIFWRRP